MSKTSENSLTKNYSGKFGDQFVFRNRYGKSILAKLPKKSKSEPTVLQAEVRKHFKQATNYAKAMLADPVLKALYQSRADKGRSAYMLAIRDYLKKPMVDLINVLGYHGKVGDKIVVEASDDFQVTKVELRIMAADDTLVEEGACIQDPIRQHWTYMATVEVDALADMKLVAVAYDNPGNTGQATLIL